jgi:hypothetical protein
MAGATEADGRSLFSGCYCEDLLGNTGKAADIQARADYINRARQHVRAFGVGLDLQ